MLKLAIKMLLGEYLLGLDLDEATRCVSELESPYFLHEAVKQAIVATIDKPVETQQAIMSLFAHLVGEQVLRIPQIQQGYERVLERMEDLQLVRHHTPQHSALHCTELHAF